MHLVSDSRATDGAVRALADAATAARDLESWLIIGGHMVNLHALRAGVDLPMRATRDADLAVDLLAVRSGGLLQRLDELGYRNTMICCRKAPAPYVLRPSRPCTADGRFLEAAAGAAPGTRTFAGGNGLTNL